MPIVALRTSGPGLFTVDASIGADRFHTRIDPVDLKVDALFAATMIPPNSRSGSPAPVELLASRYSGGAEDGRLPAPSTLLNTTPGGRQGNAEMKTGQVRVIRSFGRIDPVGEGCAVPSSGMGFSLQTE